MNKSIVYLSCQKLKFAVNNGHHTQNSPTEILNSRLPSSQTIAENIDKETDITITTNSDNIGGNTEKAELGASSKGEIDSPVTVIENENIQKTTESGKLISALHLGTTSMLLIMCSFSEFDYKAEELNKEEQAEDDKFSKSDIKVEPVDWKPPEKCYFCVDGKLLKVNEAGELVAETGTVQAEPELTNKVRYRQII